MPEVAERTLFFIKPYVPPEARQGIIATRNSLLWKRDALFVVRFPFTVPNLSLQQWYQFYEQIKPDFPEIHEEMCQDFASQEHALRGEVLEMDYSKKGEGIIEAMRRILGDRQVDRAGKDTLRKIYGELCQEGKKWRTLAHSSTHDQVKRDLELFAGWDIIPDELAV